MANNVAFEYMFINHVATIGDGGEYASVDEFKSAVMAKYAKPVKVAPPPFEAPFKPTLVKWNQQPAPAEQADAVAPQPASPVSDVAAYKVVQSNGIGWFNVSDRNGDLMSDKALRRQDADALCERLNSGVNA